MKELHSIGQDCIGGFPGHEHIHPSGQQLCLKCGKTLHDIIDKRLFYCDEEDIKRRTEEQTNMWKNLKMPKGGFVDPIS